MKSRILCYSVRLRSLYRISQKAYKAVSFDGKEDIIPESQIFGFDFEVSKSDAYWISEWILKQKSIQYSTKKKAWFDVETRKMLPTYTIEKHKPKRKIPLKTNEITSLKSE